MDEAKRFWARVKKMPSGCWEWTGSRSANQGYGQASFRSKGMGAHRAAYILTKGPIPDGMVIMHSCDNPPCCNPDHLRAGTYKENSAEMVARGRHNNGWELRFKLRQAASVRRQGA